MLLAAHGGPRLQAKIYIVAFETTYEGFRKHLAGSPKTKGKQEDSLAESAPKGLKFPQSETSTRGNLMELTERQQSAVLNATNALDRLQKDAFLAALAHLLEGRNEIGDGELCRTLRDLQREHFRPPDLGGRGVDQSQKIRKHVE